MTTLLAIIADIFLFGVLVFVHEFGHFASAKLLKVQVEEFAFGFGPKWITLFKRGETEYTIHPVPLGGFVKLAGSDPTDINMTDGFIDKPWWKRFIIFLCGPIMNLVLAFIIFCVLGLAVGVAVPTNKVVSIMPGTAADKAGMKAGDNVVAIDGRPIRDGFQMIKVIGSNADKVLHITIDRNGQIVNIVAAPKMSPNGSRAMLGFRPGSKLQRVGFRESIASNTALTMSLMVEMVRSIFSREVTKIIGGPASIFAATMSTVKTGLPDFFWLMGALSLSLTIINLMPIPVVDGGQMLLLVVEGIRRKRLSPRTLEIANQVGLTMIASIFILVMYLDLNRMVHHELFPK